MLGWACGVPLVGPPGVSVSPSWITNSYEKACYNITLGDGLDSDGGCIWNVVFLARAPANPALVVDVVVLLRGEPFVLVSMLNHLPCGVIPRIPARLFVQKAKPLGVTLPHLNTSTDAGLDEASHLTLELVVRFHLSSSFWQFASGLLLLRRAFSKPVAPFAKPFNLLIFHEFW